MWNDLTGDQRIALLGHGITVFGYLLTVLIGIIGWRIAYSHLNKQARLNFHATLFRDTLDVLGEYVNAYERFDQNTVDLMLEINLTISFAWFDESIEWTQSLKERFIRLADILFEGYFVTQGLSRKLNRYFKTQSIAFEKVTNKIRIIDLDYKEINNHTHFLHELRSYSIFRKEKEQLSTLSDTLSKQHDKLQLAISHLNEFEEVLQDLFLAEILNS